MTLKERLQKLILDFSKEEVVEYKFIQSQLEDGTPVESEGEDFEVGKELYVITEIEKSLAPDGEHLTKEGEILVTVDGLITEIKEKVEEVEEEIIEEELQEEVVEVIEEPKFEITEEDYSNLVSALEMLKSENSELKSTLETVKSEFESIKSQIEELIKTPASESPAEVIKKEEFSNTNKYMEYFHKINKLKG